MKYLYILLLTFLFIGQNQAQNVDQKFLLEVDQVDYAPLEDAIEVSASEDWDWEFIEYTIEFDQPFNFLDIDMASIDIDNFLLFDEEEYINVEISLNTIEKIDNSSAVLYKIEGDEGNRILKVEWRNIQMLDTPESYCNTQIWLHESSDVIDFYFGEGDFADTPFIFGGAVVGLVAYEDTEETEYAHLHFISKMGDETELIYTLFDTEEEIENVAHLDTYPDTGTLYRFTPDQGDSVKDITNINNLVYPNPVRDQLNLKDISSEKYNRIEILDSNGKTVLSQEVSSSIDVKDLNSGTYSILLKGSKEMAASRFVKI